MFLEVVGLCVGFLQEYLYTENPIRTRNPDDLA